MEKALQRPVDMAGPLRLAICSTGELYGGVEQFIYSFATELGKDPSVRVIVVLFNEGMLSERLRGAGVRTFVMSSFKYSPLAVVGLARLFRKEGINVVHNNGYKANILCAMAAKACGARVVKTEHGRLEPSSGLNGARMRFNLLLDRLVTKAFVSKVVFVSRDIQSCCGGSGSNGGGTVIYNGISAIEPAEALRIVAADAGRFEIGIIGRLSAVKGHIYLLEAMRRLGGEPDLRLNVYGAGDLEKALKAFCERHSLSDKVVFHGFRKDIYGCIRSLDLLVMPSLHEGLPYTLLEAMYLKVPVVASGVGGLGEILESGIDSVLVAPGDISGLARAIERLRGDPELRRDLASKAFEKVTGRFLIGGMVSKYMDVYLG
ncbi:MAG: hypothetical protein A2X99_11960 [Deltaproteobacteria bacterium GWB2_55_19]|nr:MAG: hypothetical protein A2X99_11960 [Deltaproteobacteria bacterium GWB2_55_19]HAO93323.1 hypothetical protein [Deltaproteobacteria bacterium]